MPPLSFRRFERNLAEPARAFPDWRNFSDICLKDFSKPESLPASLLEVHYGKRFALTLLMERRERILHFLQRMVIASTQQIQRLEFPCIKDGHEYYCDCFIEGHRGFGQVCKWLRLLRAEGAIESYRLRRIAVSKQGWIHTLTSRAERRILEEALDACTKNEQRKFRKRVRARHARALKLISSSRMLEHHLFSNDLLIWLYLSLSDPDNMPGESMLDEWDVHVRPTSNLSAIPDLVFKIRHYRGAAKLYVEADRGTETTFQLMEKFKEYRNLLFPASNSVLLFVEQSCKRDRGRLRSVATKYLPQSGPPRFLHTVYDSHKHLNPFTAPIWSLVAGSRCSLSDWLSSSFRQSA